jgi:chemotaxis protein CheX
VWDDFAGATREVLGFMLGVDMADASAAQGGTALEDGVSVTIGLKGDISGEILFHFPCGTALEMVGIMSGMELDGIDDFVTSAVGEISNIISGNAVTVMAARQVVCDILPPQISVGGAPAVRGAAVSAALRTTAGSVYLIVRLS